MTRPHYRAGDKVFRGDVPGIFRIIEVNPQGFRRELGETCYALSDGDVIAESNLYWDVVRGKLTACQEAGHSKDHRPGWMFNFKYDDEVREKLKASVPARDREWRPETSLWWVSKTYEHILAGLFPCFKAFRDQPRLL